MAVHPFVYFENDSPYMILRLKLAIKLYKSCFVDCRTMKERTFLIYLQRYYFSKAEVDLETIYDYEELIMDCDNSLPKFNTFEDVDNAIARIEWNIIQSGIIEGNDSFIGNELRSYTSMLSLQQDDMDTQETVLSQSTNEEKPIEAKIDENELFIEKKLNEQLKGVNTGNTGKRVNLDGMTIPLSFHHNTRNKELRLLIKNKNGIAIGNVVKMDISENDKKKQKVNEEMKKKQAQQLKQKTISLNKIEPEQEVSIQSIHNDRTPVCPQANYKRNRNTYH